MRAPANPPASKLGRLALSLVALMLATTLAGASAVADEPADYAADAVAASELGADGDADAAVGDALAGDGAQAASDADPADGALAGQLSLELPLASALGAGSDESDAPATLAGYLAGGMLRVSADVALAADGEDVEPVVGSFTVDGLTYAVTGEGEAALVAVSPRTLAGSLADGDLASSPSTPSGEGSGSGVPPRSEAEQVPSGATSPSPSSEGASSEEAEGEASASLEGDGPDATDPAALSVPASVEHDGMAYAVVSVGPRAFAGCDADAVVLSASVASVDQAAFDGSSVASIEVAEGNPAYSSYDGMLFDADTTCLLLIPEGKQGAARIPSRAEEVDASALSHSGGVSAFSVGAGCAAFYSENGFLYDSADNLLWAPPGSEEAAALAASDEGDACEADGPDGADGLPAVALGEAASSRGNTDLTLNAGGGTIYQTDKALKSLAAKPDGTKISCGCNYMKVRMLPSHPGAIHYHHGTASTSTGTHLYYLWVKPGYKVTGFRDVANPGDNFALTETLQAMSGKARTLEPSWSPQSYTITMDGGSGGYLSKGLKLVQSDTFSVTYREGMRVADILAAGSYAAYHPTKRLAGWRVKANGSYVAEGAASSEGGSTVHYLPDGAFSASEAIDIAVARGQSVVLEAQWDSVVSIGWDSCGGSAVAGTEQVVSSGAKLKLPADPTRSGYRFAGWFTAKTGGTQVSASTALPSSSTTYYAHWMSAGPYPYVHSSGSIWRSIDMTLKGKVSAASYGTPYRPQAYAASLALTSSQLVMRCVPDGASDAPQEMTYHVGTTQALAGVSKAWLVTTGADGKKAGSWLSSTATTLTSAMSRADIYLNGYGAVTVTWDANGGTVSPAKTEGVMPYATLGTLPTPTRAGHVFAGWFTAKSGGAQVSSSTQVGDKAVTYYAHWVAEGPSPRYHAPQPVWRSIDWSDGGHTAAAQMGTTYSGDMTASTLRLASGRVDMAGATGGHEVTYHVGTTQAIGGVSSAWLVRTDASGAKSGQALGSAAASVSGLKAADVYLNGAGASTVTWDPNGGSVSPAKTEGVMPYAPVGTLPTPTRAGYRFAGWFTASSGGTQVSASTLVGGDVTYHAHWAAEGPYAYFHHSGGDMRRSIDRTLGGFVGDGGQALPSGWRPGPKMADLALKGGQVVARGADDAPNEQEMTYHVGFGSSLSGVSSAWLVATDASGKKAGRALGASATSLAGLSRADVYLNGAGASTITWDADGGSVSPAKTTGVMPYATLSGPVPVREGHAFRGWYSQKGGAGTQYVDWKGAGTRLWDLSGEVTLYAKWSSFGPGVQVHMPGKEVWRLWALDTYDYNYEAGTCYERADWWLDGSHSLVRFHDGSFETDGLRTSHEGQEGRRLFYKIGASSDYKGIASTWLVGTLPDGSKEGFALPSGAAWTDVMRFEQLDAYFNGRGASTITWDPDGGTVSPGRTEGVMPYATLSGPVPVRESYAFRGWWDQPDGKGTQYCTWSGAGVRAWDKGADATLYAHWTKVGPRAVAHSPEPGIWRIYDIDDRPAFDFGLLARYDTARWWLDGSVNRVRLEGGSLESDGLRSLHAGQEGRRLRYLVGVDEACAGVESAWVVGTADDGSKQGFALAPGGGWADVTGLGFVDVYLNGAGASTVTWDANGGMLPGPDGSLAPTAETAGVMPYDVARDAPEPKRYGYAFAGWYTAADGGDYVCGAGGSTGQVSSDATYYARWVLVTDVEVPIALGTASFELGVPDGTVRVAGTDGEARAPGWLRSSMPVEVAVGAVSCEGALGASQETPGTPAAFWAAHAGFADLEVGPGDGAASPLSLKAGDALSGEGVPSWLVVPAATGAADGSLASLGELSLLYGLSLERLFADPADGGAGVDIVDLLPEASGSGFAVPTGLLRVTFTVDATRYA